MDYQLYVKMDGSIFGPYTAKEILGLGLMDDTLVSEGTGGNWRPAREYDFYDMYLKESGTVINDDGSISRGRTGRIESGPGGRTDTSTDSHSDAYTPTSQDLSKWNWGAFMFNWFWAVCHGIYWPLLLLLIVFIPFFGIIACFGACIYLGIKGTEMAWKAKSWPSWESFKKTQHKWAIAILWFYGICFAIGLIGGILSEL